MVATKEVVELVDNGGQLRHSETPKATKMVKKNVWMEIKERS